MVLEKERDFQGFMLQLKLAEIDFVQLYLPNFITYETLNWNL